MARKTKVEDIRRVSHHTVAVLKGVKEWNDASAYFGATGALHFYIGDAARRGWVTWTEGSSRTAKVTDEGLSLYNDAHLLTLGTTGRVAGWDWNRLSHEDVALIADKD